MSAWSIQRDMVWGNRVLQWDAPRFCVRLWIKPWSWPYASRRYCWLAAGFGPFGFQVLRRLP